MSKKAARPIKCLKYLTVSRRISIMKEENPASLMSMPARMTISFTLLFLAVLLPAARQAQAVTIYPYGIQVLQPRYIINGIRPVTAPQEILLKFRPGVINNQILAVLVRYQLTEISFSPYSGIRRCLLPAQIPINQAIASLRAEPAILYAEPNWLGYAHLIPNDPFWPYQWHLPMMNINAAWDISNGGGVVVAELDTGVSFENFDIYGLAPDLAGTSFVPGYDFVNDDPNPDDDEGHGTHIAGTIAQTTGNGLGCAGAAFGATIMPVKVMDSTGSGTLTDIVDGIYYAANNGAKIINMSLGFGDNPTLVLEDAVNYAYNSGCLIICSAGNAGTNTPNYPASYPVCISVSGVRYDLTLGSYSNYGLDIDLCAPGGDLIVDQNLDGYPDGILQQTHDGTNFTNFGYYMGRGTSWAAANATAVAALVISASGGGLGPADVRSILETTARDLGTAGWDQYFGWGMVDAYAAVNAAVAAAAPAQVLGARIPFTLRSPAAAALLAGAVPWISGNSLVNQQVQLLQGLQQAGQWPLQVNQQVLLQQAMWPQTALSTAAAASRSSQQQGGWGGISSATSSPIALLDASPSLAVAQILGLSDWLFPLSVAGLGSYPNTGSGSLALNSTSSQVQNQSRSSSASQLWGSQGIFPPWPLGYSLAQGSWASNSIFWPLVPGQGLGLIPAQGYARLF